MVVKYGHESGRTIWTYTRSSKTVVGWVNLNPTPFHHLLNVNSPNYDTCTV